MANNKRKRKKSRGIRNLILGVVLFAVVLAVALAVLRAHDAVEKARYPVKYEQEIRLCAQEYALEPAYVAAVILAESSYNPEAVSSADARGLMQLLPSTAEWIAGKLGESYSEDSLFQPETNIRYGCWYLHFLLERYGGDKRCASAAYHAGQGRVDQWLQDPQYSRDGRTLTTIASATTNTYVDRVLSNYEKYTKLY